jgi:hypothetical protein
MWRSVLTFLLLLSIASAEGQSPGKTISAHNYEFMNGRWFDGKGFVSRTFHLVGGSLSSRRPARVDSVFDLKGNYVVPPFGEAHNHNVEAPSVDAVIRRYLEAGIFYVKNPNSLPRTMPGIGKVNIPTSIDVVFARGGLTAAGGHPLGLVKRNIDRGNWTEADGENAFYFTINDISDLDRKWETIKAGRPDFLKTYLLHSEEYEKRKNDSAFFGLRGLNPALLPEIVRRAHKAGLRVSTHIETAPDFHNAVVAGVDEVNHMVGYSPDQNLLKSEGVSRYEISEADARLAGKNNVVVVTTLGAAIDAVKRIDESAPDASLRKEFKNLLIRNLQLLGEHNVRIAVGSDNYRQTSAFEASRLHELKVFDNLTLLKLWSETTAATIFPNRRIGHLKDGYEANFLVLAGNPVDDFSNTGRIEMRVKQGESLTLK